MVAELRTLRDVLRWTVTQFNQAKLYYGHGTDNAWDEAIYLLCTALHLDPQQSYWKTLLAARLLAEEREMLVALVRQRVTERIPVAYLTHQAWFAGLPFYVDQRVIVPRSPLAELLQRQLQPWLPEQAEGRLLDLCTGSGCIAIAAATFLPDWTVDAVDVDPQALAVAQLNVARHQLQERVQVIQSDLFSALAGKRYDVIISNPPYVSEAEYADLPAEYHQEPKISLVAADEGLALVIRMLQQAAHYLTPEGILIVEVGNSEEALRERFPNIPFLWLEFEQGGGGVFLLTATQLAQRNK